MEPKISLRPIELSDVDDFIEWAGDDKVTKYCRWNTFTSKDEALIFLRDVVASHPWYRAIIFDNEVVGSIHVTPTGSGKDERRGELAYHLKAKYWGMGIATAAVKAVVFCVFKELPWLERMEGLVFVENKGSQRVLEKAGLLREGVLRKYFFIRGKSVDIVVYSILADDVDKLD
ncbi:hypothetical protein Scep_030279 [Stephania cephalantha]|uniref:N-acetyltransferase domain-containing protein n=1 Tax=Stephania cephalantha TaxID=152367 RepID=A0AAP0E2J9_9MAGN